MFKLRDEVPESATLIATGTASSIISENARPTCARGPARLKPRIGSAGSQAPHLSSLFSCDSKAERCAEAWPAIDTKETKATAHRNFTAER